MLPFAIVDGVPVLVGTDESGVLVGVSVPDVDVTPFDLREVTGLVSIDPAAVYWGASMQLNAQAIAAAPRKRPGHFQPRGQLFDPLPPGEVSGYPMVRSVLEQHRAQVPSVDVVRLSALFAVSTVRVTIEKAEESFQCFVGLYEARARETLPSIEEIKTCFRGLQNSKSKMFSEVAAYAPVIQDAIARGLKDRELRRYLVRETPLPTGLGVAKMSFTLALLGHDCVCLDARLMARMFMGDALKVAGGWGHKSDGRVSDLSLGRYEAAEDAFLKGNPFYDPKDPIGKAHAQWAAWEGVGGKGATHGVWLNVVTKDARHGMHVVDEDFVEDRREGARRGWEHRRERDEFVTQNISPDLLPLWHRIGGQFKGTPDERFDEFMEYVEMHSNERIEAAQKDADAKLDALIQQRMAGAPIARAPVARAVEESLQYRGVYFDVITAGGGSFVRIGEQRLKNAGPFATRDEAIQAAHDHIDEMMDGSAPTPPPVMSRRPKPPNPIALAQLAAAFLSDIEDYRSSSWKDYLSDARVPKIVAALTSLGIKDGIGPVLGHGAFGTATVLPDGRVLKLTSDPSETQAGYALVGKKLPHVAEIYGAWFVRGVRVRATLSVDENNRPVATRLWPMGISIVERVTPLDRTTSAFQGLTGTVIEFKRTFRLFPEHLTKIGPVRARAVLKKASEDLEVALRDNGRWLRDRDMMEDAYLAEGVADALKETRAHGVYAVDVHGGNVGYVEDARGDRVYKIFDIGSSSAPGTPHAPTVPEGPPARGKKNEPNDTQLPLLGMLAEPQPVPWVGQGHDAMEATEPRPKARRSASR